MSKKRKIKKLKRKIKELKHILVLLDCAGRMWGSASKCE